MAVFVILALLGFAAMQGAKWELRRPGPHAAPASLIIAKGTPTLEMGRQLAAAGIVDSAYTFAGAVHLFKGKALKAGEYQFATQASLAEVIGEMRLGRVVVHRVTIPEGLTNLEIAALLRAEPALAGDLGSLPPEGHLMPDTYTFTRGDSRSSIVQRMHAASDRTLAELWSGREAARTDKLNLTPERALVLASIVEKETGVAGERPRVAAVFYNRLNKGMMLETDPTLIYAMSNGQGTLGRPLGHHDLALVSPYNSYTTLGLPPGPICNPGRAALVAALHPANDDSLYFVATGQGGHNFAATLADHDRNVAQYIRTLREKAATVQPSR